MVTRIHKTRKPTLYLKEHREARNISADMMAGRLGIERESVYRIEREPKRVNMQRQIEWAEALGMDDPAELWYPPGQGDLRSRIAAEPSEAQAEIASGILARLGARR